MNSNALERPTAEEEQVIGGVLVDGGNEDWLPSGDRSKGRGGTADAVWEIPRPVTCVFPWDGAEWSKAMRSTRARRRWGGVGAEIMSAHVQARPPAVLWRASLGLSRSWSRVYLRGSEAGRVAAPAAELLSSAWSDGVAATLRGYGGSGGAGRDEWAESAGLSAPGLSMEGKSAQMVLNADATPMLHYGRACGWWATDEGTALMEGAVAAGGELARAARRGKKVDLESRIMMAEREHLTIEGDLARFWGAVVRPFYLPLTRQVLSPLLRALRRRANRIRTSNNTTTLPPLPANFAGPWGDQESLPLDAAIVPPEEDTPDAILPVRRQPIEPSAIYDWDTFPPILRPGDKQPQEDSAVRGKKSGKKRKGKKGGSSSSVSVLVRRRGRAAVVWMDRVSGAVEDWEAVEADEDSAVVPLKGEVDAGGEFSDDGGVEEGSNIPRRATRGAIDDVRRDEQRKDDAMIRERGLEADFDSDLAPLSLLIAAEQDRLERIKTSNDDRMTAVLQRIHASCEWKHVGTQLGGPHDAKKWETLLGKDSTSDWELCKEVICPKFEQEEEEEEEEKAEETKKKVGVQTKNLVVRRRELPLAVRVRSRRARAQPKLRFALTSADGRVEEASIGATKALAVSSDLGYYHIRCGFREARLEGGTNWGLDEYITPTTMLERNELWEAIVLETAFAVESWRLVRDAFVRGTRDRGPDFNRRGKEVLPASWAIAAPGRVQPAASGEADDEDAVCAVCWDGRSLDDAPVLFCDGCGLAVHTRCVGLATVPEGDWLCDVCECSRRIGERDGMLLEAAAQCAMCSVRGGFLRRTVDGQWAHIRCVLLSPGTWIDDPVNMRGICMQPVASSARSRRLCLDSQIAALLTHGFAAADPIHFSFLLFNSMQLRQPSSSTSSSSISPTVKKPSSSPQSTENSPKVSSGGGATPSSSSSSTKKPTIKKSSSVSSGGGATPSSSSSSTKKPTTTAKKSTSKKSTTISSGAAPTSSNKPASSSGSSSKRRKAQKQPANRSRRPQRPSLRNLRLGAGPRVAVTEIRDWSTDLERLGDYEDEQGRWSTSAPELPSGRAGASTNAPHMFAPTSTRAPAARKLKRPPPTWRWSERNRDTPRGKVRIVTEARGRASLSVRFVYCVPAAQADSHIKLTGKRGSQRNGPTSSEVGVPQPNHPRIRAAIDALVNSVRLEEYFLRGWNIF